MGKVAEPRPPQLHITVDTPLLRRIAAESKRISQPMTAWVRLAIVEKLERDERP